MRIETFDGFIKNVCLGYGCVYEKLKNDFMAQFGDFCFDDMLNIKNRKLTPDDFLYENLNSHDWKLLKKQLMKHFPDNVLDVYIDDGVDNGKLSYVVVKTKNMNELLSSLKFNELLWFFNYFITYKQGDELYLEPKYSDKVNITNEFVYHLTKKQNLNNIRKKGIQCRCGETKYLEFGQKEIIKYRDFPERIYIFTVKDDSKESLIDMCDSLNVDKDSVVLKIKNNKNLTFFRDVAYTNKNMFFTYDNIPKQIIVDEISLF